MSVKLKSSETLSEKPVPTEDQVNQALAYMSLKEFIQLNWRSVETKPFQSNWHIDALSEHLEAVSFGQIKKLIINIPPRHMKSLSVSVFWPAWWWLHKPEHQWLFASYAESLSIRDSVKCRRVIQSPYYQGLLQVFQPDLVLVGDQNTKTRYENNLGGYRLATSVGGALTGEGGDTIGIDDAHNVIEAESQTRRLGVLNWWDEAMSTRLNDPKTGAYVVMMQRTHERDLTGHILANESDWTVLCIPARWEGKERSVTKLEYEDPRTKIDEPLWPSRFGDKELKVIENKLGPYGTAGQLQQRPSPRGGGMFKVENFTLTKDFNRHMIVKSVRYWDKAGTQGGGKRTAGTLIHKMRDDYKYPFVIESCVKGQWSALNREERIKQCAQLDTKALQKDVRHDKQPNYEIWVEQEPGSGGKESAEASIRNLAGFNIHKNRVTGDKEDRAEPYCIQVEAGNIALLIRDWTEAFIDEHEMAPKGTFKDQWDSAAGAFIKVNSQETIAGIWGTPRR